METDINTKYALALEELKKAYAEIDKLKKENETLRNAILNNSKVIIQQDSSLELIAAHEIIKTLQQEIHRMNNERYERNRQQWECEERMENQVRRLKLERGID